MKYIHALNVPTDTLISNYLFILSNLSKVVAFFWHFSSMCSQKYIFHVGKKTIIHKWRKSKYIGEKSKKWKSGQLSLVEKEGDLCCCDWGALLSYGGNASFLFYRYSSLYIFVFLALWLGYKSKVWPGMGKDHVLG